MNPKRRRLQRQRRKDRLATYSALRLGWVRDLTQLRRVDNRRFPDLYSTTYVQTYVRSLGTTFVWVPDYFAALIKAANP